MALRLRYSRAMLTSYGETPMPVLDYPFYAKPITLDTLDDLFAHHRAHAGGFKMTAPPPADPPKEDPPPKFEPVTSQEDFDKRLGERLGRQKTQIEAQFADYAALKTKAGEHDKAIEAARTDQEKAVEAAKSEGRTEALAAANTRLLSAEARALAAEAKFHNPTLAVRALDLTGVKVNDDGSVDAEAIKAKLKELVDSGAFVIGDGQKPKPKPDGAQGGNTKDKAGSLTGLGGDALYDRLHPKKTNA